MSSTGRRRRRLLVAGAALVALAVVATPAGQATHKGYLQLAHSNLTNGTTFIGRNDEAAPSFSVQGGRLGLSVNTGTETFSGDADPALRARSTNNEPCDPTQICTVGGNAIEAKAIRTARSAVLAEHIGAGGYGLYATATNGNGVFGFGKFGVEGMSNSTAGVGVTASNTTFGTALQVIGKSFLNGSVGVGTQWPVSKLQVVGNYVQLPTLTTAPPADDCDEAREAGRVVVRAAATAPNLYICRGTSGWRGI